MGNHSQVVVCGAGPVGLITALKFAQAGLEVTVIDAESTLNDSPRANIYLPASMEAFDSLGILDDVREASYLNQSAGWYAPDYNWSCRLPELPGDAGPYMRIMHVGQEEVGAILVKHLQRFENAQILWNTCLTGIKEQTDSVTQQIETGQETQTMSCDWLVGADGAGSSVRSLAGIDFLGHTWPERLFATNVNFDFSSINLADVNFRMDPHSFAVIVRVNKHGVWRIAFGESSSLPEENAVERATSRLSEFIPEGEQYDVLRLSPYRIHQRASETLHKSRIVLAGDAAHATNPIGGLGLSTGIWDGMILGDILPAVINKKVNEEALQAYSKERLRVFWELTSPMASNNKRVIQERDPIKRREDMAFLERMLTTPEGLQKFASQSYSFIGDPIIKDSPWRKYHQG
jgi:2-polyprenyl-6-methoxyphenol hydroxylase-like FAD-dependent oxidoreductase